GERGHEADLAGVALPPAVRHAAVDDGAAQAHAEEDVEVAFQGAAHTVVALAHGGRRRVVLEEDLEVDAFAQALAHRDVLPTGEAFGVDDVIDHAMRDAQRTREADAYAPHAVGVDRPGQPLHRARHEVDGHLG